MIEVPVQDRISMSQRERDVLAIMKGVVSGDRTVAEAARLLNKNIRQVRRLKGVVPSRREPSLAKRLQVTGNLGHREDISIGA